jgi:hypothetical protein
MQLQDVFRVSYAATELDADGNQAVDPGDTAALTVDDSSKATIVADAAVDPEKVPAGADPAKVLQTGFIVGGKTLGVVNITTTFAHADGSQAPPPVVTALEIVSGPPATGGLSLGVPIPQ